MELFDTTPASSKHSSSEWESLSNARAPSTQATSPVPLPMVSDQNHMHNTEPDCVGKIDPSMGANTPYTSNTLDGTFHQTRLGRISYQPELNIFYKVFHGLNGNGRDSTVDSWACKTCHLELPPCNLWQSTGNTRCGIDSHPMFELETFDGLGDDKPCMAHTFP